MENRSREIDWRAVIIFVAIAYSSQCGGGFATGSTPWSYFFMNTGFYGMLPRLEQSLYSVFMPLIVAIINCFIIYFFMKFAMDFITFDYSSFLKRYGANFWGGKMSKPMQIIYEFNFNWLLIVCMALAYSSSGSALNELTGIPYIYTTFIVGIMMFVLCMKGTDLVRKNAVFMSVVIVIALVVIHVPNIIFNIASGNLSNEMEMMQAYINESVATGKGSVFKYLLTAFVWAYIFSGQNLAGFGAYVNHAQIFKNKKTLRVAVFLSVMVNWIFLEMNAINLASHYSEIRKGWLSGKAVYTIMVIKNGVGGKTLKLIMLGLLTVAIFFATISTAINYVQGFNDRILNWYQKKKGEKTEVSDRLRNKRGAILTFVYICITWVVSQVGLTALVAKGLTLVSYINLVTLIFPTIMNVCIGWKDAEYESINGA